MSTFSRRMAQMKETAAIVRNLFGAMGNPEIISFGGGAPAAEALPIDAVRQIVEEVIRPDRRGPEALQYGNIMGVADLREHIVTDLLAPKGIEAGPDDVMIVNGGLEGLYLLTQAVIDPGDVILVESPTFVHAVETFQLAGATCIPCPMDDHGLVVEAVEENIRRHRPKLVYVIPTFQNPTGKTLPQNRWEQLAELGSRYDVLILEDDPYCEIRYSGSPLRPIKASDKTGHTIYANSFSKVFSPGSRLGYIVAPPALMSCLGDVKSATNSHTGMLPQVILAEFFARGLFFDHLAHICGIHRERRDAMMECCNQFLPQAQHTYPHGGLFTWVELPEAFDTEALLPRAQWEFQVSYVAGKGFFVEPDKGRNCMRLSFGKTTPAAIYTGMERLGRLFSGG